jgi:hypothetical protein
MNLNLNEYESGSEIESESESELNLIGTVDWENKPLLVRTRGFDIGRSSEASSPRSLQGPE